MATENNLPNNDPDLILAQKIGASIESGSLFSEINDSLIDQLLDYKESELNASSISASISDSIWNQIENETKKQPAKITPLFARPSTFAWASAAVILITAFIGFYWITLQPQVELVAQSGPDIEVIILDDGSEVTLRPNSSLSRIKSSENVRSYRLEGEAFFDVASYPTSPFSVDGNQGTVTVLGTRFNLSTWGEKSIVYLEEGSIAFTSNLTGEEVRLSSGQSSQVQEGEIELLSQANADQFIDWISNTIVFNGNSPDEVIYEINQHFGVTINIDQLLDRSGIDGSLQLESINQTLDDLGLVLGGTFRQISDNEFEFISME
jgi:ferric-dicitrate binding protein FerR (iron transport regulator)